MSRVGIFSATYQGELHGARMTARAIMELLPCYIGDAAILRKDEKKAFLKAILRFIIENTMEYVDNGYLTDFWFRNHVKDKKGKLTYAEAYYATAKN